jgi:hypothetical protein
MVILETRGSFSGDTKPCLCGGRWMVKTYQRRNITAIDRSSIPTMILSSNRKMLNAPCYMPYRSTQRSRFRLSKEHRSSRVGRIEADPKSRCTRLCACGALTTIILTGPLLSRCSAYCIIIIRSGRLSSSCAYSPKAWYELQ